MHKESSDLAGKTVRIAGHVGHAQFKIAGADFEVWDWWDHLTGESWMISDGNSACLIYAMRTAMAPYKIPNDDEVLYGQVGIRGVLVHMTELDTNGTDAP